MPCDQIRLMRVAVREVVRNQYEVGRVDRALLDAALCELRIPVKACEYDGTTLTIRSQGSTLDLTLDQIKVAYSQQVVTATAKRYGWKLRVQETNDQGEPVYTYQKAV